MTTPNTINGNVYNSNGEIICPLNITKISDFEGIFLGYQYGNYAKTYYGNNFIFPNSLPLNNNIPYGIYLNSNTSNYLSSGIIYCTVYNDDIDLITIYMCSQAGGGGFSYTTPFSSSHETQTTGSASGGCGSYAFQYCFSAIGASQDNPICFCIIASIYNDAEGGSGTTPPISGSPSSFTIGITDANNPTYTNLTNELTFSLPSNDYTFNDGSSLNLTTNLSGNSAQNGEPNQPYIQPLYNGPSNGIICSNIHNGSYSYSITNINPLPSNSIGGGEGNKNGGTGYYLNIALYDINFYIGSGGGFGYPSNGTGNSNGSGGTDAGNGGSQNYNNAGNASSFGCGGGGASYTNNDNILTTSFSGGNPYPPCFIVYIQT